MKDTEQKISLLDAVPIHSEHISTGWEGECAVLSYPRFKRAWMQRWLLPKGMSPDIHVPLEEHGSAVWRLIDGRRTVQEIIDLLADHFRDDLTYASRVAAYVLQLRKDKFIRLQTSK